MKRKTLLLFAIITAVSLSACTNNPDSMADKTGANFAASSVSTVENSGTEETDCKAESQTSSFEQVNALTEPESTASESTMSITSEAPRGHTTEVSKSLVPESTEKPQSVETQQTVPESHAIPESQGSPQTEPANPTAPPVATNPEPTPTQSPVTPEPKPTEPTFDVSSYVLYAKSYGAGIGLSLDSAAISCWDDPLTANASCLYLERDIRDRLDWYLASGFTSFWVWSEDAGGGNYLIYIGYA